MVGRVSAHYGMGIEGHHVYGVDDFRAAFSQAAEAKGPVLLDIDMSTLHPLTSVR